jgi:tyramine---L-glutamate ligase
MNDNAIQQIYHWNDVQNKPIKTIFVCEFITGGGLNHHALPQSLLAQGQYMRDALLHDLFALPYQIITTVDSRLNAPQYCHACHLVHTEDDVWQKWAALISEVDAVWLIAPETSGGLAKLTAIATMQHTLILGCGLHAVDVCSSKLATYRLLNHAGVETVETYTYEEWPKTDGIIWLSKPDDGAGCEDTVYFEEVNALTQWLLQDRYRLTYVIQPYWVGNAGSISCVMYKGKAHLLSCNQQLISARNNKLIYQGCLVNGMQQHWEKFAILANRIAQLLPDLIGYVGIDVIVKQSTNDNETITVVDINPRLTTSFIALREATGCNVAELIINTLIYQGLFLYRCFYRL